VTLKEGVEKMIIENLDGVNQIIDTTDHANEMDEWERSVVCRRCGEQFLR